MKIKLVLTSGTDQAIWENAERTALRVQQWPAWKRGGGREDSTVAVGADVSAQPDSTVDKK